MAVTSREQEMLALADRGLTTAEIASRMGIKRDSVVRTLGLLSGNGSEDRLREARIRSGSDRLIEAIGRSYPERVQ